MANYNIAWGRGISQRLCVKIQVGKGWGINVVSDEKVAEACWPYIFNYVIPSVP